MKTKAAALFALALILSSTALAREFFVATNGDDANPGTKRRPLRTIQRGAELAQPGDIITVRAGVYRERVNPPRGGTSDRRRIVYQAAQGERVELKGSEVIKQWAQVQSDVWKATVPNTMFGEFNPFNDLIHGDWFDPKGRPHHTGAVYLNGDWLVEAAALEEVMAKTDARPAWLKDWDQPETPALWFARVDQTNTTIWAQFKEIDPNQQVVEINVRQTVFYPDQPGRNFLTVRGFIMAQAATPWAPPTAQQIGLLGTHWSKGWIIENNVISHSICSGIALGKYGDQFDNTSANSAEGYVKTIQRALQNGWNGETIGHHVVRNNTIAHCEQAGIVGSLGAAFSTITGNTIHDIHVRHLFTGAEMAGIKFHAAIDTVISSNHVYRTCRGLWLDWMAQGTRVSANLFHENAGQDLFLEVDHGPFLIDNNLFLSPVNLLDMSEGGAYAHNLFAGKLVTRPEPSRKTPFHPAHSTTVAGLVDIKGGDDRFFNNIFVGAGAELSGSAKNGAGSTSVSTKDPEWSGGYGLWVYNFRELPSQSTGNLYCNGALCYRNECTSTSLAQFDPKLKLVQSGNHFVLHFTVASELDKVDTKLVTSANLGTAKIPNLPYENASGLPVEISDDYFGKPRSRTHPTPGPFEQSGTCALVLQVW